MRKPTSSWVLFFCIWTLICGVAVLALGVWNGLEVAWSELSLAIVGIGGVLIFLSALGIMASRGCTCCCNVGLYLFVFLMGLMVLGQTAFIIAALIKESDWVADLAKEHGSDDNVDHLKEKYDEFWPYVIGFGAATAFGCLCAFFAGYFLIQKHNHQDIEASVFIKSPEKSYDMEVKNRHRQVAVEMGRKYGHIAKNVFSKKKSFK
ncbi:hypothetical protein BSKO_04101 [Bryopsis sp. KO-2023]|nr:hypothetical protein BSKO_04101 [Bryopsis sp. KO-2023]